MIAAAPDLIEPIEGWRSWLISTDGDATRLRSVVRGDLWEPRQPFLAECAAARGSAAIRRHAPPSVECSCGVHAARVRSEAEGHLAPPSRRTGIAAIGRVALWGEVIEGEIGWRGACAYPVWVELVTWNDDPAMVADLGRVRRTIERAYGIRVVAPAVDRHRAPSPRRWSPAIPWTAGHPIGAE
jgi:hypothetical protein